MAGPWEKYQQPSESAQQPAASGPWAKYQRQDAASPAEEGAPRGLSMQQAPERPAGEPGASQPDMAEPWQSGAAGRAPQERQQEPAKASPRPAPPQEERIRASDFGLEALEGGVSGVGSAVGGTGDFLTWGGNLVESCLLYTSPSPRD